MTTSCELHDVVTLEEKGIPTVNIATTEFLSAAHAQCAALGMPQYEPILVPHPIQPKLQDEVCVLADQIVGKLLKQKVQQAA